MEAPQFHTPNGTGVVYDFGGNGGINGPPFENESYYNQGYGDGSLDEETLTHSIYYYKSFHFEKPLYLYFWTVLICLTTIANVLIIMVLVQKNMRTSTNLILAVIACTDALTGLVTLPLAYIYSGEGQSGVTHRVEMTESLCKVFMFLRYFLSRSFHTMSIWLTVLLALERMVLVRYPFKADAYFTLKRTGYVIGVIILLSPFLHIYHAVGAHLESIYNHSSQKYEYQCVWNLEEPCGAGCVYMWSVFHLMHFIPCLLLLILSMLMMKSLFSSKMLQYSLSQRALKSREAENRRVLSVVIAVVVVFLIPETMYGIYRFVEVAKHHAKAEGATALSLNTKRGFRSAYEVLLVLSFHANFWIYLVMNRKFRRGIANLLFGLRCFKLCNLYRIRADSVSRAESKSRSGSSGPRGSMFQNPWRRKTSDSGKSTTSTLDSSRRIKLQNMSELKQVEDEGHNT